MSITKSVLSVVKTSTEPLLPAGTTTAFAATVPVGSFSEATTGRICPVGQAVRKPKGPGGTAAKFNAYAFALAGTPHALCRTGNVRVVWAVKLGPPSGAAALRVSAIRQGVSG